MNGDKSLRSIFSEALELNDAEARARYLDDACGDDPALRRKVEGLLEAHRKAGGFLPEQGQAVASGEQPSDPAPGTVRLELPPQEQPGTSIGRYKLRERIGEGGCGIVYVAEQEEPIHRCVALKVIKPGMDTRQVIARFEAERQALAIMDHPNIAKVLDAGTTENGRPYFVMELVRGIRITEYCDQNHLDTTQRLELFIQVCNAVQHAHQKGIIHRDLKPSNLLVTLHDGVPVPKVIDFGIAKATEGRLTDLTVYTALHQFIGTPAYMSPEQAEMSGLDIDTRSDIYSLGVLLYELLTGTTPFDAEQLLRAGLDEMRRRIREEEPPRPSTRLSTLDMAQAVALAKARQMKVQVLVNLVRGDLDWIVMKCLEKDRTRRYETVTGLATDIKRYLYHEPVAARPPSKLYRFQKLVRRNKLAFAAAAAVGVALVLGIVVSTWALFREQTARKEADLRRQDAEKARADEKQQRLRAEAEKLTARRFAYASDMNLAQQALAANNLGLARELLQRNRPERGQADLRRWEWRYLWRSCQGDFIFTLPRQFDSVLMIRFASAGGLLAVRDINGAVMLWNPATRRQVGERSAVGYGRALTVSGDGSLLAYGTENSLGLPSVVLWSMTTLSTTAQFESRANPLSLSLSPDGETLAALCEDRTVRLWNLKTHRMIASLPAKRADGMHKGIVLFSPDATLLAVGESDGQIRLLDVTALREKYELSASPEGITALAFSPDGAVLASGSGFSETAIKLWKVSTGEAAGVLAGHNSWVSSLAFSPDGTTLASASSDQTIRLWNVVERQQVSLLRGHLNEIYTLAFSPDGKTLASASKDGAVNLWDAATRRRAAGYLVLPESIDRFAFSADGKTLVTVNRDRTVSLWDTTSDEKKATLMALGTNNTEVAISQNGSLLAVGTQNGVVRIWDLAAGIEATNFVAHSSSVVHLRFLFSPKGLITIGAPDLLKRWEIGSWRETASWRLGENVTCIDLSADERLIATGHRDGTVSVWDATTGTKVRQFLGHRRMVTGVGFTPDGKLVSGSDDSLAKLWEPTGGSEQAVFRGHLLAVHSVAVSPDGRRLATGGNAREAIKLWDWATRQEAGTLAGKGTIFFKTIFSPDGNLLASLNVQGALHIWRAPSLAEIDAIESVKSN